LIELTPETAVPIKELLEQFTFWNPERPEFWQGKVQGSPNAWNEKDGELIVAAMQSAVASPVVRPIQDRPAAAPGTGG